MAGNPFRRSFNTSGHQQLPDAAGDDGDEGSAGPAPSTPPVRAKKVSFVSPPQSPEEPPFAEPFPSVADFEDGLKSPPPANISFARIDPKALLRGEGPGADSNPSSPALARPPTTFGASNITRSDGSAPANPFAKTLATMEPGGTGPGRPEEAAKSQAGAQGYGKPVMDVDAFKRMLLTGNAGPPASGQTAQKTENGSSTDASSISKQSISEIGLNTRTDSPRSSLDGTRSPDSSSDDEYTDHTGLVSGRVGHRSKAQPPSPPAPRHAKTRPKAPQTMSFSEFDDFEGLQPSAEETIDPRPGLKRVDSDLNKPLPNPPDVSSTAAQSRAVQPGQSDPAKKSMPPPPPTRRQNTGTSFTSRPRSASNLSKVSTPADEVDAPTLRPDVSKPTPPPSRRTASPQREAKDEGRMSRTSPMESPSLEPQTSKSKPAPPPSRGKGGLGVSRTPSTPSVMSLGARGTSPNQGGTGAAPPPPPPRRGETKRRSFDGGPTERRTSSDSIASTADYRRSSVHSFDSGRRESMSSLQPVDEDATSSGPPKDILADLAALQKEVDALRAQAGRHG